MPNPDPTDLLDWNRERDGLMADAATATEPETHAYVVDEES